MAGIFDKNVGGHFWELPWDVEVTCRTADEVLSHALVSAPSDEIFSENDKGDDGFEHALSGVIIKNPAADITAIRGKEHGN